MSSRTEQQAIYAKLSQPKLQDVLRRERLYRLMLAGPRNASLWVEGPAGSGKSTLVNSYLDANGVPCIWYRFDERDADIGNFFFYLSKAVEVAVPGKDQALPALTPEYLLDVPAYARNFFASVYRLIQSALPERPPGGYAIVFDDYHLVPQQSPLHNIMMIALSELPDDMRLLFISRTTMPPLLVPAHANRRLAAIGWEDIRLTEEETFGIVQLITKRQNPQKLAQALHESTRGWVAGLILLLEHARRSGDDESWLISVPLQIHDYFAETIFDRMDEETRDFLLKSAFLSFMTVEMAAQVSGCNHAERILERLHRDNFFTEKRQSGTTIYLYHALLREFLLARAKKTLLPEELMRIRKQAGAVLMAAGFIEQAADIFKEAGEWVSLTQLVLQNAQDLLQQGRSSLLQSWLQAMPQSCLSAAPWLLYWKGFCQLYVEPHQARGDFEAAYRQFEQAGDRAGQFLSWAAIVDTGMLVWEFNFLGAWIATMERLLKQDDSFPSPQIAARVTVAMFNARMFHEPWYEKIAPWKERLELCIRSCPDHEQQLLMSLYLVIYLSWLGRLQEMTNLMGVLRPNSLENIRPLVRLHWCIIEAYYAWFMADWEQCDRMIGLCLKTGEATGVRVLDGVAYAQGVFGALGAGDMPKGREYLDRMKAAIQSTPMNLNRSHYYFQEGWYAALDGKPDEAIRHLKTSLEISEAEETPLPVLAENIELAGMLLERGDLDQAEEYLKISEAINAKMCTVTMGIKCLLVRTRLAWKRGQNDVALPLLRQAMGLARTQGFSNLPWWYPPAMAEACVKALEAGIEPDYVRELVRKRRLVPAVPPVHLEDWPWDLKVYTLGRFAVIRDGKPIRFTGKAQRMPLILLKILIALGGREVSESKLTEILWSGAEAESAHSSFTTTLHRLRRLLGHADLLLMRDGRLTLNPCCCWVDVWNFERALSQLDAVWPDAETGDSSIAGRAENALRLYQGAFLPDEDGGEYAVFSARERYRDKYLNLVNRLGAYYVAQNRCSEAAACLERGLEVDDLVEEFYHNLMACYDRLGARTKALQVYERCRKILRARFGIGPSRKTEALYQSLLEGRGSDRE